MPGNVMVFNIYNEPVTNLLVGNNNAGNIAGWATGPNPPQYTPSGLPVKRTKYPSDESASFAYGDNPMVFPWHSRTGKTTVNIPVSTSLDDDLILYLSQNEAILLTARGVVISTSTVTTTLSLAEMQRDGHV